MGKFTQVRRLPALVFAFSVVALATAAIAIADNLLADGDGLTANGIDGDNSTLAFGTVSCDQDTSKDVVLAVNRNGSGTNVYKDGSTVTVSAADDASAVSTSFSGTIITLPSNWGSLANNTKSSPVTATVTIHPTTTGAGSATVTFTGSGINSSNASIARPDSASVSWNVVSCDTTAPTSSATAKNADNSDYAFGTWTNQNVTVTLSGQDNEGGSGLREIRYTTDGTTPTASHGTVYGSPFTISAEGTTTVKWRAIDSAGNLEDVHTETVKIDKTAPVITDLGPTAPPNGDNGWYRSNVTNQFHAEDEAGGSGLSAACDAAFDQPGDIKNVVISDEGSAVTGSSGPCSDAAGNPADPIDSDPFMIDKTAPTVAVTGVTHGASYTVGSVPVAGCSTSDDTSGVQTAATLSSSGGPVGSITATCSGGKDKAGNTAAFVSATYSVLFAFNGFYQPIDNNGVFNKAKAGSAIPVKFSVDGAPVPGSNTQGLGGAPSAFLPGTTTNPNPAIAALACPSSLLLVDPIEELSADSTSGLKYDPSADQWVYVWKTTTGLANSCRQLKVTLADGTVRTANFQFTK